MERPTLALAFSWDSQVCGLSVKVGSVLSKIKWGIFICLTKITTCLINFSFCFTETIKSLFLLTTSPFYSYAHKICILLFSPDLDAHTKISGTDFLRNNCNSFVILICSLESHFLSKHYWHLGYILILCHKNLPAISKVICWYRESSAVACSLHGWESRSCSNSRKLLENITLGLLW